MDDRLRFRAFIKDTGVLMTDVTGFVIDLNKEKIRIFRMNSDMKDGMSSKLDALDNVVMDQCTAIKDIKESLLFESDIIRYNDGRLGLVVWNERYYGLCCFANMHLDNIPLEFEIVGNIQVGIKRNFKIFKCVDCHTHPTNFSIRFWIIGIKTTLCW